MVMKRQIQRINNRHSKSLKKLRAKSFRGDDANEGDNFQIQAPSKRSSLAVSNNGNEKQPAHGIKFDIDYNTIVFKPLFSFFDRNDTRSKKWKRPIPEKLEDRIDINLLTIEERRERALQLWAIGIRKAKIMKSVDNNIKLYGASKIIDENLYIDGDMDGIK